MMKAKYEREAERNTTKLRHFDGLYCDDTRATELQWPVCQAVSEGTGVIDKKAYMNADMCCFH